MIHKKRNKERKNNICIMGISKEEKDVFKALGAFTGVIIVVAAVGFLMMRKGPETVQGEVEVSEYRVSSKVPSRVMQLLKHEGDRVRRGDTLAVMEAPDVEAKLAQAEASRSAAEAQNEKAQNGTRSEVVQTAYNLWQQATAGLTIANKSYDRVKALYDEGVVSAQKFDEATAQRDAAIATEQAAHSQYEMALNGAQREDKAAAAALVAAANGMVDEVNSYISETYLTAPCDGEVTETFPQPGELVGSGSPIMTIAMDGSKWVTFNVREDMLSDIREGSRVTAFVPAMDNKEIELNIYYMKDLGTYAAWKAVKTTGQYDLKTFEVRARAESGVLDNLRAGMSVIMKK